MSFKKKRFPTSFYFLKKKDSNHRRRSGSDYEEEQQIQESLLQCDSRKKELELEQNRDISENQQLTNLML